MLRCNLFYKMVVEDGTWIVTKNNKNEQKLVKQRIVVKIGYKGKNRIHDNLPAFISPFIVKAFLFVIIIYDIEFSVCIINVTLPPYQA